MDSIHSKVLFDELHIWRDLIGEKFPLEPNAIEKLIVFFLLNFSICSSPLVVSPLPLRLFDFPALDTLKHNIGVFLGVNIRTQTMHPPLTVIAHDPLLAIVRCIGVNLFAIQAIRLVLKLLLAICTKSLHVDLNLFGHALDEVSAEFVGTWEELLFGFEWGPGIVDEVLVWGGTRMLGSLHGVVIQMTKTAGLFQCTVGYAQLFGRFPVWSFAVIEEGSFCLHGFWLEIRTIIALKSRIRLLLFDATSDSFLLYSVLLLRFFCVICSNKNLIK